MEHKMSQITRTEVLAKKRERYARAGKEHKTKIINELVELFGYHRKAATTLSGGEAQRVKLAAELSRKATGRTFYILDEPTTGLHFHDVAKLLEVLFKLRNTGNTLVVIEHNLDVIKTADWIIDLGPEGGDAGGRIVAQGPPEAVARCAESFTGQYLKNVLVV
jgi:excinuclease ABC subunit A